VFLQLEFLQLALYHPMLLVLLDRLHLCHHRLLQWPYLLGILF
jgi:hypothetical protein